jgi:hypothetical protein
MEWPQGHALLRLRLSRLRDLRERDERDGSGALERRDSGIDPLVSHVETFLCSQSVGTPEAENPLVRQRNAPGLGAA